jgi:hypothetical protein
MKKFLIFLLTALIPILSIYAQEQKPEETIINQNPKPISLINNEKYTNIYDNSIGLVYSTISGYGLTYWRRIFSNYSVCLSGMIMYDEYMKWTDMTNSKVEQDTKNILYDYGFEIQRDIFVSRDTRIYALLGTYLSNENNKNINNQKVVDNFTLGVGFGLQWFFHERSAFFFHFGYKFDQNNTEENNKPSLTKETKIGYGIGWSFFF